MTEVMTARLGEEINKDIELIARKEHLDKSTVLRKLLKKSLANWKKQYAISMYKQEKYSTEQAAKFAGVSLWRFFDMLRKAKIPLSYDLEELEKDILNIQ